MMHANGSVAAPNEERTLADPRVTVIIPVFQGESSILGCVRSALAQTYQNLEIIIVDDGSTDGTWALLQTLEDDRIRLFRQSNSGASAARNLALAHATGVYIALLDADDVWLPQKIEREVATFRANGNPVAIVYSWYYCVDEDGILLRRSPKATYSGNVLQNLLSARFFIIPSATLFHRSVFDDVGVFDAKRRYHEDFAFVLRACRKHPAFPTKGYGAIYKQSLNGKARRVMQDYEAAVHASLSIASDSRDFLSETEVERLTTFLRRELYFRFLMYGFNRSAQQLLCDIPTASLRGGAKGWLGWFFAKTRVNLMLPSRKLVQTSNRTILRRPWRRFLKRAGVFEFVHAGGGR